MAYRPPNTDFFDAYFRIADLDQDGRISGAEAVAFFQGSNLPNHILAKIWIHADQKRTGFLGRTEFYNALKLVTVAQSGRELTPDIVKAALFGPAAAKIPAPQINTVASPTPQMNAVAPPVPQVNAVAPPASQNLAFRGSQVLSNVGATQQSFPSSDNQFMRPLQAPQVTPPPIQGINHGTPGASSIVGPRAPIPNASIDWLGGMTGVGVASTGVNLQVGNRGAGASSSMTQDGFGQAVSAVQGRLTPSVQPKHPQDAALPSFQPAVKDSNALSVSGNGFTSKSIFGGDVFSVTPSQPNQDVGPAPTFSANVVPNLLSVAASMVSTETQSSVKVGQLDATRLNMMPSGGSQVQQAPSASGVPASSILGGVGSTSAQSQLPWPRITQTDIQKYTAVFVEVDKDRDGKITGQEARNLFLSWRLPREVLKQAWDLSDQDNDSMLSLKEFCTALYLMERYREGRPLPPVLPSSMGLDEALLPAAGQPVTTFGSASWRPTGSQQGFSGAQLVPPATGVVAPAQDNTPQTNEATQPVQPKSRVPVLEKHLVNQLSQDEQSALNSKSQDATEAEKKVEELEKEILDAKEKIQFYRTKMQEIVLYKSRCDNRLNEITERASADTREVDALIKKYEEKYKQVGDVASKLTVEEATFRDIQERKLDLYHAIAKMEQGGIADGMLQARTEQIQTDLEELVKALNERCKSYGLRAKPTTLIELPFGWQPGIQEGAADWDEDWDKFGEEGFMVIKELTIDDDKAVSSTKPKKSPNALDDKSNTDEGSAVAPSSNHEVDKVEKPSIPGQCTTESGPSPAQSGDDSARSPPASPATSLLESPSKESSAPQFEKNTSLNDAFSAKENQSMHGGEPTVSGEKFVDEAPWGATFTDANDNNDSVWGFNSTINTKDPDHDKGRFNSFFGSNDFGLNPIRTGSPHAENVFGKEKGPLSFDSIPNTPLFNTTSPPRYSVGSEEHSFDSFSRFDSFSANDSGVFPRHETLTRFDSIRSTSYSDQGQGGFPSFDDADPFGTSLFKPTKSQTPRRPSDNWSAF